MDESIMAQTNMADLLNSLIHEEWEAVARIRGAISVIQSLGDNKELDEIFQDILNDNMIHIGQLEKSLQTLVPEAAKIEDGREEAEEKLDLPEEEPEEKIEIESPELNEAMYSDRVPSYVHIANVGLYSTGCSPEEYEKESEEGHYEIDVDNKVFTRVKGRNFLGHWFIESYPRDTMKEVEQTAKNIMENGDYKEVSNEEYLKIQNNWEDPELKVE